MKVFIALAVLVAVSIAAPADETGYAAAYDFEALFKNDEQRTAAFDCMLDKKPCGEFQKLKDTVFEVLLNDCAECTPEQKTKYDNVHKMFKDQYEAEYTELMKKISSLQKKE